MTDPTITFAAPETRSAVGICFEAVGASVRGPAHEATGQPCQDFFAIEVCKDWVVAVVSDGKTEIRKVRVKRDLGTMVEVDTGVKTGDQVILNPPVTLVDGSKVQRRPEPAVPIK